MDSIIGAQSAHFSISENSACTQAEHDPFPLMKKGESDLVLPLIPKGEIAGIMTQVLSLMAMFSGGRSQSRQSEWKKIRYTQVPLSKVAYTRNITNPKACMHMHTLSCKQKCVHVEKGMLGPWYLVQHI